MLLPLLFACGREPGPWVLQPGFEDRISHGNVCIWPGGLSWWGYAPAEHVAFGASVPETGVWFELGDEGSEASVRAVTGTNLERDMDPNPCDDIVIGVEIHDYHYEVVSGAVRAGTDGEGIAIEVEGVVLRATEQRDGAEGAAALPDVPVSDGWLPSF